MRRTLRAPGARVLDGRDLPAVRRLLAADPVRHVFVAARVEAAGLEPWRLRAEVWGHETGGTLDALCYSGANLVPVGAQGRALRAFADRARRSGRRCSSIVGPADEVLEMWAILRPDWGPARDVRECQPLLATDRPPAVPGDPLVRRVRPDELGILLPACVAMFTEELGISPLTGGGEGLYRARVAEIVEAGRAFARIEDGRVLFKAEIGAVSRAGAQLQGVWVDPALRGRGLGTAGTATVVAETLRSLAPVVSLYVNDYNEAARRSYEHIGFEQVDTFASVLF